MEQLAFIQRLFNYTEYKVQVAAFFAAVISAICSFSSYVLGISGFLFMILFVIMLADYRTGILAAKKEKQVLTSKRGLQWVWKFGFYLIILSLGLHMRLYCIENGLDILNYPMKLAHFYVLIHITNWELKSIDENLERMNVKFRVYKPFEVIFESMKNVITSKLK